jgi:hypothetical protein
MHCHELVVLPPQLERFLLTCSWKSGSAGPTGFSEHADQGSASYDSGSRYRGWGACSRLERLGEAQGNVITNHLRVTREVAPAAEKIGSGRLFYARFIRRA